MADDLSSAIISGAGGGIDAPVATTEAEGGSGNPYVTVSMSHVNVELHTVTADQLSRLMELTRDPWKERYSFLLGAAIAVFPSVGESLYKAYFIEPAIPLSVYHLIEILILGGSAFGAFLIKRFTKPSEAEAEALYKQIMSRPTRKMSIGN